MIPKLREERIAEYTYVHTKRTVTSIILSVAFRRHNKPLFKSQKGVIESRFLSAPTFEAVL